MKTKTKALTLVLCAVLLVVTTVFTTVAFLTSKDTVKNTFTVGKVALTLDETKVNADGTVVLPAVPVKENEYHLIPGHAYTKDPTIHVAADSENCWLFVKLENGLKDIIAGKMTPNNPNIPDRFDTVYTIEAQMENNGWTCIDTTNNIWAYKSVVTKGTDVEVFTSFELKDDADVSEYATAKDPEGNATGANVINVTAYAVQADGFTTANAAWTATFGN